MVRVNKNSTYHFLTLRKKPEILDKLKIGGSVRHIATEYGVGKSTVSDIKKNKEKIESCAVRTESSLCSRKTMKSAEYDLMEEKLFSWFQRKRLQHIPISEILVCAKAKELFDEIYGGTHTFFASRGWLHNFKKRFGVRSLKISGEILSNDYNVVKPFKIKFKERVKEMNLQLCQIYNADETALFWRKLPEKTLALRTEKCAAGRKIGKERVTLLVCSNATGKHRLKLLMIGKFKSPRALKGQSLPVEYVSSKNAWIMEVLFKEWFHASFVKQIRHYLKSEGLLERALLLLDNATCHSTKSEIRSDDGKICVMFFPPNCTALIQLMDQNAIRMLKLSYRKSFLCYILATLDDDLMKCIKKFNLKDVAMIVTNAWSSVTKSTLRKRWNTLLGVDEWESEDELRIFTLREHLTARSEENVIIDLLNDIAPDVYQFPEVNEWVADGAIQELSSEGEDDEDQIDKPLVENTKVSHGEAVSALNKCIEYAEQEEYNINEILCLQKLREKAMLDLKRIRVRQAKITNFFK